MTQLFCEFVSSSCFFTAFDRSFIRLDAFNLGATSFSGSACSIYDTDKVGGQYIRHSPKINL